MKDWQKLRSKENLDRIIKERFSGSLMNNHKWVKLLTVLVENAHLIKQCQVKLIWEEYSERKLLIDENTTYQFDYYPSSMESMITGKPFGWYAYEEIEWIAFPAKSGTLTQDIQQIHRILGQVGELSVEMEEGALKVYGYK